MPSGLGALDDDEVAAGLHRSASLGQRAHLPRGQRPAVMHQADQGRVRVGIEELDHPHPARRDLHDVAVKERHQDIQPHRARCPARQRIQRDRYLTGGHEHHADHAQAAGICHRGARIRRRALASSDALAASWRPP